MSIEERILNDSSCSPYVDKGRRYVEIAFRDGAEWAENNVIERLRELQSGYENDLDVEPRVYERHIQLCAKISLIERLINELEA